MVEVSYGELQEEFGSKFIARLDGQVVCAADTFEELVQMMRDQGVDESKVVIEYIEPSDQIIIYNFAGP